MNQEELQQKIREYYGKLPESLQKFFADMNWLNSLQEINTVYGLNPEQIEILSTETTLVLLCIIPMEEYVGTLKSEIKINDDQKDKMLNDLNEKIFKDIGYELEEMFIKNANDLAEEKYGGEKSLDERFNNLPKEVQDAISKSDYQTKLYKIAQDHKLNIEQMGIFEEITIKVILNTIHGDQYENELINKTGLPKDEIVKIVEEVNENVFKQIRNFEMSGGVITNSELGIKNNEIPLPPYKTITNPELGIKNDEKKDINTDERLQMKDEKKEEKPLNILEEKITKPVTNQQTTSDYSITKTIPKIEDIKRSGQSDPYREAF